MALTADQLTIRLFEYDYDSEHTLRVHGEILKFFQEACADGDAKRVDDFMYNLDTDCIPASYLGGILRYSINFASEHLNNWYEFRERCIQTMIRRGDDPNDALYGLLEENILQSHEPSELFTHMLGLHMKKITE